MAILQTAEGRSTGSVDSFGLAYDNNLVANTVLVVCAGSFTQEVLDTSITDTLSHTFARNRHDGGAQRSAILSVINVSTGANTVTINTAANSFFSLVLYELSEMESDYPTLINVAAGGSGAGGPGTGNFTPTANCLGIGHMAHSSGTTTISSDTGWTTDEEEEDATFIPYNAQSRLLTASTSYSCNWVCSVNYACSVVGFALATAVAGHPTRRRFGGVPHLGQGRAFGRTW